MDVLDEAGVEHIVPEGAFYMWCKAPESFGADDMAFCDYLKKYNILSAPGSGFGGKGWIRLAYCVSVKSSFCKDRRTCGHGERACHSAYKNGA